MNKILSKMQQPSIAIVRDPSARWFTSRVLRRSTGFVCGVTLAIRAEIAKWSKVVGEAKIETQ
jgi:hypothetical protein